MIVLSFLLYFFFFFSSRRRHTRLQGDWSSDVCSSDLGAYGSHLCRRTGVDLHARDHPGAGDRGQVRPLNPVGRSEERRVGKECRWRWGRGDEKEKEKKDRRDE